MSDITFTLQRNSSTSLGMTGKLSTDDNGGFSCFTVERPWLNNDPALHSAIPAATYRVRRSNPYNEFPKHPGCFTITNVVDRTAILIHVANVFLDLLGCVGLGTSIGTMTLPSGVERYEGYEGQTVPAVLHSGTAYQEFMDFLDGIDEFTLIIVDAP